MSYTFFDAQLDLAREIMDCWESVATGGSTTTVVDTALAYPDGYFSDQPRGTLFLDLATRATKVITGHSSTTITFIPAQSGDVAASDVYMAAPGIYPKYILEQSIKMALRTLGKIPFATDVTMVVDQEEWDNTDDEVFDEDIVAVEFASNAAQPFQWTSHYRWYQTMLDGTKTLIFNEGASPKSTNNMRVFYLADHPSLDDLDTEISSYIAPERLLWNAAIHALRWRLQKLRQVADNVEGLTGLMTEAKQNLLDITQQQLAEAEQNAVNMQKLYPIERTKTPHHARW